MKKKMVVPPPIPLDGGSNFFLFGGVNFVLKFCYQSVKLLVRVPGGVADTGAMTPLGIRQYL